MLGAGNDHTAIRAGYLGARTLPDGRQLDVLPLLFGRARLMVTLAVDVEAGMFADDAWEYPSHESALTALAEWDGDGDAPYGWDRHPKSQRRRPGGDATREEVRA